MLYTVAKPYLSPTHWYGQKPTVQREIPFAKRVFDVGLVLVFIPLFIPILALVSLSLLLFEGRPIFYSAQRCGQGGKSFRLYKFRTMRIDLKATNTGVSGGHKSHRVSFMCRFLRRSRLDELPQIFNVLKGDMSLVGPRPPDPYYVAKFPHVYDPILRTRPGVTGLATLYMHRFEDRVLGRCQSAGETDRVYCTRCIPRKARLDRLYQTQWKRAGGILFDSAILVRSVVAVLKTRRT